MRILWLVSTPFGDKGEEIEYPPTTKPFMLKVIAGAVFTGHAAMVRKTLSMEMLDAMSEYFNRTDDYSAMREAQIFYASVSCAFYGDSMVLFAENPFEVLYRG